MLPAAYNITHKVVFITGARGIGKGTAQGLAAAGSASASMTGQTLCGEDYTQSSYVGHQTSCMPDAASASCRRRAA